MRFGFSDAHGRIWFEARYASFLSRFKPIIDSPPALTSLGAACRAVGIGTKGLRTPWNLLDVVCYKTDYETGCQALPRTKMPKTFTGGLMHFVPFL